MATPCRWAIISYAWSNLEEGGDPRFTHGMRDPPLQVFQRDGPGSSAFCSRRRRFYLASKEGHPEVGIRQRPNEDLYLNFRPGMSDDNKRAVIQAYVFSAWFSIVGVGGLVSDRRQRFICLWSPARSRDCSTPARKWMGIGKKHGKRCKK